MIIYLSLDMADLKLYAKQKKNKKEGDEGEQEKHLEYRE